MSHVMLINIANRNNIISITEKLNTSVLIDCKIDRIGRRSNCRPVFMSTDAALSILLWIDLFTFLAQPFLLSHLKVPHIKSTSLKMSILT